MDQIKISIIMPVYNTGEYLEEALRSLFSQSFQEFELICVDDSSDDILTRNLLSDYQNQHKNMRVIWLENNVGAGEARNIGFSKATGDYTIFLDADDLFAEEFLEKMYQCIEVNHADVCLCGYEEFYIEKGKRYSGNRYIPNDYKVYFEDREDWLLNLPMAPWNKLCKTQFLKENNMYFQSLGSWNDVFFSCMVMMKAREKCYVKDIPLVFYRTHSKIQISARRNPVDLYKAVKQVYDFRENDSELLLKWINALLLYHGIWAMRNCSNEAYNQQFYELLREYFKKNSVDFQNDMLSVCIDHIKNKSYKKEWVFECTDLLYQLHFFAEKLKERIQGEGPLFLWGLGYRGNIFERFCVEQEIVLDGITDIKDNHIGDKTEYENKIVSAKYVLQSNGLIIAANEEIYRYLQQRAKGCKIKLLNLAEFYAF